MENGGFGRRDISQYVKKTEAAGDSRNRNYQTVSGSCILPKIAGKYNEQFIDSENRLISGSCKDSGFLLTTRRIYPPFFPPETVSPMLAKAL